MFKDAGYNNTQCLLASWGFGLLNFLFAIPAVFTIDTFGRRNLLLSTFPNMAWTLLVTGLMFLLPGPVKGEDGEFISKGSPARLPLIALVRCCLYLPLTPVYLPLRNLLQCRRGSRAVCVLCRGIPNHSVSWNVSLLTSAVKLEWDGPSRHVSSGRRFSVSPGPR